ncbi:MAG: hypothetical protein N838_22775 [Thiohalocapsa sp. PB-PSB1]|nr:MAG: hypothetical protein N838_15420 [Thiohalocapsa sp. PB-PSB1]QQO55755.1 MAG: hypothetical protein N838_22775 [Thiohalocapsa sp. PB-PSB1]
MASKLRSFRQPRTDLTVLLVSSDGSRSLGDIGLAFNKTRDQGSKICSTGPTTLIWTGPWSSRTSPMARPTTQPARGPS